MNLEQSFPMHAPLAFTSVSGFDIPSDVRGETSNPPTQGGAWALLQVAGVSTLYRINPADATATQQARPASP